MKKSMVAFIISVVAPLSIAYGAGNGVTKTRTTTTTYRRASTTQKAEPTTTKFYYTNQEGRKKYSDASDTYAAKSYNETKKSSSSEYSQKKYVSQERKYFLAHPFFQPLKGRFGSVTDIAWAKNSMSFDILNSVVYDIDPGSATYYGTTGDPLFPLTPINVGAKAETNQFLIKEDFSFGITDKIALIVLGQYDSTKLKLKDWESGDPETKSSDSGLNVYGFGVQTRFLDTPKTIGMAIVEYERQRDTANSLAAELKLGYKLDRTTLYLVGRGGYSWLKNKDSSYGFFIDDNTGDWFMLTYKRNVDDLFFVNGGVGAFAVLNKYLTLNAEAVFGNYDWHNQLTGKLAFGVQPFDMFALNLYVSGVLYDSGEGKVKEYLNYDVNPVDSSGTPLGTDLTYTVGDYKIKDYNEYKIGAQFILYF